jgi:hypothetical protein
VGVTADAGVRDRRVAVPALLGNAAGACGDPRPGLGAQGARGDGAFRGSAGAGSRAARRRAMRSAATGASRSDRRAGAVTSRRSLWGSFVPFGR